MTKILGLDLGTNSIGWAIVEDDSHKILGMGSRIFPIGVDNVGDGEKEMSKNASRTGARGVRRQFFRRRFRKKLLLQKLSQYNMCPLNDTDFEKWKEEKKFPEERLSSWFANNPYELRDKALKEKLSLEEIGRVFYHLIQRRGFLSNSRKGGNEDGAIFKGKDDKIGITSTLKSIEKTTLGSYLHEIYPKDNEPFEQGLERIRNRYTTRKMYVDEFELIWQKQAEFYPQFDQSLKTIFGGRKIDGYSDDGILFHQRPLRSQKHLVGHCSFEESKTKCPLSAIIFEEFRVWQWVNTIDCNGRKISNEEKEKIVEFLFSVEKPDFKKIRKVIQKEGSEYKFNYKNNDKIVGTHTISSLSHKKFFGNEWYEFTEKKQEDIWHVLYFFDSKSNLKEYALAKWNFTEVQAEAISKFNVKEGYSSLSRKAILNILPFLKQGYTYDVAVVMGGIKNSFGKVWQNSSLQEDKKQLEFIDNVEDIVRSKISGGFIEIIKSQLKKEFGFQEQQLKKLYHHSASINTGSILKKLPLGKQADKELQQIRNPIVVTALFELRKLVNELVDDYGLIDEIKVEMARDLKVSKSQRNKIRNNQKRLERENDRIKNEVEKYTRITHDTILKFKLWEECKKTCPYTGKQISIQDLFSGEVQIEHIHPWSRSLNDSFNNKTLCWADENRKKGNLTPYEFYGGDDNNWSGIKERVLKLFSDTKEYPNSYQKFKRFVQQTFEEDFTSRQLNDTRYISKEAKNYLRKICLNVSVAPGQLTANLRQKWGLNSVLNVANKKTREDHRHHAIDALVMACSKESYLQELSKWNRYNRKSELKDFPVPWKTFRYDAEKVSDKILVSHKRTTNDITVRTHVTKKGENIHKNIGVAARGQLHKETVFGKRTAPNEKSAFHVRKPIDSITTEKQLEKVVDVTTKKLIFKRINELGGFIKGKIPLNTFFIVDENGVKQPQVFLPNKNGNPVPILKLRVKENFSGVEQLKDNLNQWVNPRKNHHVLVYKDEQDSLKEKIVTFWTVVERKRKGFPIYQLPFNGKEIITTLHINDMFLLGLDEHEINWEEPDYEVLRDCIYRVQKLTSGDYFFRKHTSSTVTDNNYIQIRGFGNGKTGWHTFTPVKIKLSVSGKIEKYF